MINSFVGYIIGALLARLGDEMSSIALLLLGLSVSHSGATGSAIVAGLTFAAALGGPLLGALLDRSVWPGRLLTGALALYAAGLALITISLGHMPTTLVIGLAMVSGLLMPAISGGWSSQVKALVRETALTRASALDAATYNIAGLAGPALAGLAATQFGANWTMVLVVSLFLLALPFAWTLPKRPRLGETKTHLLADVRAGFRAISTNQPLLRTTLTSVISYMGIGMMTAAAPLVGRYTVGNGGFGGILLSTLSVSALIATALYSKYSLHKTPDVIVFVSTIILAIALAILAYAHSATIALLAMLLVGLADGPQLAAVFAVRSREAPTRLRSQVFTTGASLKISGAAFGFALAGGIAIHSIFACLMTAAVVQLVAAAAYLLVSRPSGQISAAA